MTMRQSTRTRMRRERRARRTRVNVRGTAERPRLSVFRSNRRLFAQLINDGAGVTVASASDRELPRGAKARAMDRRSRANWVGERMAERARKLGITRVRFDRGSYRYHGVVAALAEGARRGGLVL